MQQTKSSTVKIGKKAATNTNGDMHTRPPVTGRSKIAKAHPAGQKGNKTGPQLNSGSVNKISPKAANRKSLFERIKNVPVFKG